MNFEIMMVDWESHVNLECLQSPLQMAGMAKMCVGADVEFKLACQPVRSLEVLGRSLFIQTMTMMLTMKAKTREPSL